MGSQSLKVVNTLSTTKWTIGQQVLPIQLTIPETIARNYPSMTCKAVSLPQNLLRAFTFSRGRRNSLNHDKKDYHYEWSPEPSPWVSSPCSSWRYGSWQTPRPFGLPAISGVFPQTCQCLLPRRILHALHGDSIKTTWTLQRHTLWELWLHVLRLSMKSVFDL